MGCRLPFVTHGMSCASSMSRRCQYPTSLARIRDRLSTLAQTCTNAAHERFTVQSAVRRRILDLAPPDRAKLTGKLHDWHDLDFAAFRAEVKRAFHAEIPLRERGEWEGYLRENAERVRELTERVAGAEREIDQIVYALFDLTAEEVELLEQSAQRPVLTQHDCSIGLRRIANGAATP